MLKMTCFVTVAFPIVREVKLWKFCNHCALGPHTEGQSEARCRFLHSEKRLADFLVTPIKTRECHESEVIAKFPLS